MKEFNTGTFYAKEQGGRIQLTLDPLMMDGNRFTFPLSDAEKFRDWLNEVLEQPKEKAPIRQRNVMTRPEFEEKIKE